MQHGSEAVLSAPKVGVSLSQLLAGVTKAVAAAYGTGVWTVVEVMELRVVNRHVYLGLSERDANGTVLAKVNGIIWGAAADTLVPAFERMTGTHLAPGLKLLVRARPVFKSQYGFSLEIDAIDEQFTLGDFEMRKKEIRQKLRDEGLFAANKALPRPWDFNAVLVVAPANGAGLGDFQAEASRLASLKICHFEYCYSRFQGDGAGAEIRVALVDALKAWKARVGTPPDAIVIIRGGGAVSDLAWLNDFGLTRLICRLPIPVFTGIGHERDTTLLDEVSNQSFDTPSKVIVGIERMILHRVREACTAYEAIATMATHALQAATVNIERHHSAVRTGAGHRLEVAKRLSHNLHSSVTQGAYQQINGARTQTDTAHHAVRSLAAQSVASLKAQIPALRKEIILSALNHAGAMRQRSDLAMAAISSGARAQIEQGRMQSQALVREIAGQGPEKTLKRGFALVLASDGQALSRAAQATPGTRVRIQFSDGTVPAHIDDGADSHVGRIDCPR